MNSFPQNNSFYCNSICGVSVIFILQFLSTDFFVIIGCCKLTK